MQTTRKYRSLLTIIAVMAVSVLAFSITPVTAQQQITIKTAGQWPFVEVPTEAQIESDPFYALYDQIVQDWLAENPNVTIELIDFDPWNQQGLLTAIAGGTAPTAWSATVLGGYNMQNTRAAFRQGLAADVTELYAEYEMDNLVATYIQDYNANWIVDERMYAVPVNFNPGNSIVYRRDLVNELGLEHPVAGWTWDDFAELAAALTTDERWGAAMPPWGMTWYLRSYGYGALPTAINIVPDPSTGWNWRYDFTHDAEGMAQRIGEYRAMIFDDRSLLTDVNMFDQQVEQALLDGTAAMGQLHAGFLRNRAPGKFIDVAQQNEMALEEMWGFAPFPVGTAPEIQHPFGDAVAFNPDLSDAELAAAFDLYHYMWLGEGYERLVQGIYEQTNDLQRIWGEFPTLTGNTSFEGVEGGPADAWGETLASEFEIAANRPIWPNVADFQPAEANPAPSLLAYNDAISRWTNTPGDLNLVAEIAEMETNINAELRVFESSVADEDFVTGLVNYYDVLNTFYETHAPDFYENTWLPWYNESIVPVIE